MEGSAPGAIGVDMVNRVKELFTNPKGCWDKIKAEPTEESALYFPYATTLIVIAAACMFIGQQVFGIPVPLVGSVRPPFFHSLVSAIVMVIGQLAMICIFAQVMCLLAPKFGGQDDRLSATKLTVYSLTPGLVGGFLQIVPVIGIIGALLGFYGLYLLYQGCSTMLGVKTESRIPFLLLSIVGGGIGGAVVFFVLGFVTPGLA